MSGTNTAQGHGVTGVILPAGAGTAVYGDNSSTLSNAYAGYFNGRFLVTSPSAYKAGGGSWLSTSDERVKRDIKPFQQGLAEIERVRPIRFKYNGLGGTQDTGTEFVGVIAQELERISPAMVNSERTKLHKDDAQETDIKQVDPSAFTYMLINAVQEQQKLIRSQEARIAKLERARGPVASSLLAPGVGAGLAFGLFPLSLIAARRVRRGSTKG